MLSPQAVAVTAEPDGRSAPEVSLDARVRRCRVGTTGNRGQFRLHTGLMVPFGDGHQGYPGLSQSLKMVVEWIGRARISQRPYEGSPG